MEPQGAQGVLSVAMSDLELTQLMPVTGLSCGRLSVETDHQPKARGDRRVFRSSSGPVSRVLRKLRVIG
jgi:hypothetical protein